MTKTSGFTYVMNDVVRLRWGDRPEFVAEAAQGDEIPELARWVDDLHK